MDQFWSFGLVPSFPFVLFGLLLSLWERTTMYNETFTPGYASLSVSTEQQSQSSTLRKDCHLGHRHHSVAPVYGFSGIDVQESQCLIPLSCDDCAVSIPELSGCPTTSAPLLVPNSSLPAHLNGERRSVQATSPLEYITGENGTSSIVSPAVNQGWNMQDHTTGHVINYYNVTPSFPHTSLPPPYIIARSSGYPQANVDISIFRDLVHDSVEPMTGLSSMPAFHDYTAGQVFDSNASGLSSQLSSLLEERYLSDGFNDNAPLPLEQARTEMAAPDQVLINFPRQLIKKTNLPTPIPYACPTPSQSQSHSTSYFTTHDHISFCPAFPAPIRTPTSQYPQPHFGYHLAVQSHFTAPVDLPGFCEFRAGTKMELHEIGTFDNHPLPTLPDHSAGMTSGGIANHGKTDGNKCNYIAAKVKVLCRWCALSTEKKVTRKNLLRHLREAHLHYPR